MTRFQRPELNYKYSDLEPYIDSETMEIHHTKHHQAYVNGLGKLSDSIPSASSLQTLLNGVVENKGISASDKEVLIQFGGGHYNHSLFWEYMAKGSNISEISDFLFDRIKADFGSLEELQERFDKASIAVFGSGWAWWVYDYSANKSYIMSTKDQLNPIMTNTDTVCLLGLDVWEHAYYLKYQNKRAEYVNAFWNVVNWKKVSLIHDNVVLNRKTLEITDNGYIKFD